VDVFIAWQFFRQADVTHWIDESQTAMCPKCDIDSVIGSASGFPIDVRFLKQMEGQWFGTIKNQNSAKVDPALRDA